MKLVSLLMAAVIAGVVRYPVEGDLLVSDDEAIRLTEGGFAAESADEPLTGGPEADELDDKTVAQLQEVAAAEKIDLQGKTLKADIVAAIRAARATA